MDKKKQVEAAIVGIMIASLISVLLLGVNKVSVNSGNKLVIVTDKESRENGFTDLIGFGYGITVYEEEAYEGDRVLVENCYNKIAGTISTWNGEMTLSEYKEYENDLNCVNGMILKSETADDNIVYYYENGEKLKVNFISKIEHTYKHEVEDSDKIIKTSKVDGVEYTEYDSGVVKQTYYTIEGAQDEISFVSNTYFDIVNFLGSYIIILIIVGVIELIVLKAMIRHKNN